MRVGVVPRDMASAAGPPTLLPGSAPGVAADCEAADPWTAKLYSL